MAVEFGNDLRPAAQRVLAHAHHARLGHCRLGQRRQHGRGHARGRAVGLRAMGVVERNLVALARECAGQQAAHETRAQNGDARGRL